MTAFVKTAKVKAYDIAPEIARQYADEMGRKLDVEVEPVSDLADAVKGLDIVVTSGPILKHPDPPIPAGWLAPGAFASLVDFDSYWQGPALAEADKLATDDHAQMSYYRTVGYFSETPQPYADLGEPAVGAKSGRESPAERTLCINLCPAPGDMATGPLVYHRPVDLPPGRPLPL